MSVAEATGLSQMEVPTSSFEVSIVIYVHTQFIMLFIKFLKCMYYKLQDLTTTTFGSFHIAPPPIIEGHHLMWYYFYYVVNI